MSSEDRRQCLIIICFVLFFLVLDTPMFICSLYTVIIRSVLSDVGNTVIDQKSTHHMCFVA